MLYEVITDEVVPDDGFFNGLIERARISHAGGAAIGDHVIAKALEIGLV